LKETKEKDYGVIGYMNPICHPDMFSA